MNSVQLVTVLTVLLLGVAADGARLMKEVTDESEEFSVDNKALPKEVIVTIKLDEYSNPQNLLLDGRRCDRTTKCDPFFNVVYTVSNGAQGNLISSKHRDVGSVQFGSFASIPNVIVLKVPRRATIKVHITALEDDGSFHPKQLIGEFDFSYIAGTASSSQVQASGTTNFGVSFH